jgi:hypothetical protein
MKFLISLCIASLGLVHADSIPVENNELLKTKIGQVVTVVGVPNAKSAIAASGHFFYNFDQSELVVFCFKASAATFPAEKKPAALIGKKILVTGKVTLYKEKLQIAIRGPEDISLDGAAPVTPAVEEEKPVAPELEKQPADEKKKDSVEKPKKAA